MIIVPVFSVEAKIIENLEIPVLLFKMVLNNKTGL